MIMHEMLDKPYEKYTIRSQIWLKCDYCGETFQRVKKSIQRVNSNVNKDSCGKGECKNLKAKEVNLVLYGNENYFATKEFKQKQTTTNTRDYGTAEYFSSKDFAEKREKTLNDTLGVNSPLKSQKVRDNQAETCEKRHGVRNYSQHKDFKVKIQEACKKRTPEEKERLKREKEETMKGICGKPYITQTDEYWVNREIKCLAEKGVRHESQLKENRDLAKETSRGRYGFPYYTQTKEFKEWLRKFSIETYGVSCTLLLKRPYGKAQGEVCDWLHSIGCNGFKQNQYLEALEGKEIDLLDAGSKIGIEYNGNFWHTEVSPQPRGMSYHYNKYKKCLDGGIQLITIFEDEWKSKRTQCQNRIKSILGKHSRKIYARKCVVKEIDSKICRDFCEVNHIQGDPIFTKVCYGLFYNDELVQIISLCKHHRNNDNKSAVLNRLCSVADTQIIGGASRLFSRCVTWAKQNGYSDIVSWSDNRWSNGSIYKTLNFALDEELPPDYSYVNLKKPYERISKQSQKKSNTGCPAEITEREWALQNKLARIWDCGKIRWKYSL